ncbi:MAG: capsular biosynthesis protein [Isosphaeraceae bacterium]
MPTTALPPSSTPDPMTLARALRRRWKLAAALGIVLASATVGLVLLEMPPPKYKAQSMLQVATEAPRVVLDTRETQTDFKTYQKTQEAYLRSRLVLEAAMEKQGIKDLKAVRTQGDPVNWLEKQILVDFAGGSEILRIGMTGEDPNGLAMIVNAVTDAYMEQVVDAELKKRRDRQKMLKDNWDRYQGRLKDRRSELKRLGELAGGNDKQALASVHQSGQERLSRAEEELVRIQSEQRSLSVELALLEKQKELTTRRVSPGAVDEQIARDPEVLALADRVAEAQNLWNKVSRVARKSNDAAHHEFRRSLTAATRALNDRIAQLRPTFAAQLAKSSGEDVQIKVELARERANVLARQEAVLQDEVKRLSNQARIITRTSVDVASIQEEIAAADEVAKKLAIEIESLNVELQAPPRVRLVQKAEVPRETDKNRVVKLAGGAGIGVFVLCLAGVSFWEFQARRIESAHEVESKLGIRVVGSLPALPRRAAGQDGSRGEIEIDWENRLIDSVDAARTAVLHAARVGNLRVVMVTSGDQDEGKTSFACHLAASLARAGRKTLLIDFDLRNPRVHANFGLADGPGVSEVLRSEATAADVAVEVEQTGLWVIPAGRRDSRAVGAVASDGARLLFEEAREDFSFIVVDSAPVLQVTDALQVGQYVDAAILSVMRGVSRGPEVYSACRKLASLGIPLFGAVVADMPEGEPGNDGFWPFVRAPKMPQAAAHDVPEDPRDPPHRF